MTNSNSYIDVSPKVILNELEKKKKREGKKMKEKKKEILAKERDFFKIPLHTKHCIAFRNDTFTHT